MSEFVALPPSFYEPSARIVAKRLLGHYLLRRHAGGLSGGLIVETEAYLCAEDPACHAASGETDRNRSMWGPPGFGYVYLIYGCHFCFNAVCRPRGQPEAVLIRAITADVGLPWMQGNRQVEHVKQITNGPAKLCAALNVNRSLDGVNLCDTLSPLFIAENSSVQDVRRKKGPVVQTTRIGISKAEDLNLRFYLGSSEFVSKWA